MPLESGLACNVITRKGISSLFQVEIDKKAKNKHNIE